ncbi:MAG: AAA family ATPase [Pyrinomonadaceae bacterium]|nr:AAA family ATPase [Pyrinomonadaceae bacterium]
MLSLLNISNIAVIDELRVEFGRGLNLLTGETGFGKSIIVDTLGILIGGRFTSDLIKTGAERGFIEGLFSVTPSPPSAAALAAAGIKGEIGDGAEGAEAAHLGSHAGNGYHHRRELAALRSVNDL